MKVLSFKAVSPPNPTPVKSGRPRIGFGQGSEATQWGKTLTIQQSAKVEKMPDSLQVGFPVLIQGKTEQQVITSLNQKTAPLVQALKSLKIPKLQVGTSPIHVSPVYKKDEKGHIAEPRKIIGYEGSQNVTAMVKGVSSKNLSQYASKLVSTGLNHGSDGVHGPYPFLSKREKAEESAVRKAVKLATRLATAAAQAAGLSLGSARQIQVGTGDAYSGYGRGGGIRTFSAAAMHRSAHPPEVSEETFQVVPETVESPPVTIHFELMDSQADKSEPTA